MLPKLHFSIERWRKNTEYGVWVSNQGNVKLIKNKETLSPRINGSGYCMVFTELGAVLVHRLVAYTWLGGKRNAKYNIDHINSNKRDNSVKNLRWVTKEINLEYAAFTSCKMPEETEKQKSIEEDEDILSILFNKNLLIEQRVEEFRNLLNENKIQVCVDRNVITTYEQLTNIKNNYINNAFDMDCFIKRIISVADQNKKYCGKLWKVKVI